MLTHAHLDRPTRERATIHGAADKNKYAPLLGAISVALVLFCVGLVYFGFVVLGWSLACMSLSGAGECKCKRT